MKNQKFVLALLLGIGCPWLLWGQEAIPATGGEATGTGGSSTYTAGLVVYTTQGSGPSLSGGVQQPFELSSFPIELLYFQAEVTEKQEVLLSWATESELNSDYFTVERSHDTRLWQVISQVTGSGTTHEPQVYHSSDASPFTGTSYYRLKQTDYDGSITYSDIVEVHIEGLLLLLYPNPAYEMLTLQIKERKAGLIRYQIWDEMGRSVSSGSTEKESTQIDLQGLSSGRYFLEIRNDRGKVGLESFIKVN